LSVVCYWSVVYSGCCCSCKLSCSCCLVIWDVHVWSVRLNGFSGRLDCVRTMVVIERPVAAGAFVEPFPSALSRDGASVRVHSSRVCAHT